MNPAREVGGDLYDYFIQDEKLFFCIGDVSGKGVPASLFMAVAHNLFRVVGQHIPSPAEIAKQLNETLSQDNEQMMFVTMFIGVIDLRTGSLTYCNCGHNPPVILDGKGCTFMDCQSNTPVGAVPGWVFQEQHIPNIKGKTLFLYTDGLNEAENRGHEEFGNDRLLQTLAAAPQTRAEDIVRYLLDAVTQHVRGAEASDDLTLLCLKVK